MRPGFPLSAMSVNQEIIPIGRGPWKLWKDQSRQQRLGYRYGEIEAFLEQTWLKLRGDFFEE